nr:alpha/beta fold hydrolase [uncultured Pseudodesulfovibrio sp.]
MLIFILSLMVFIIVVLSVLRYGAFILSNGIAGQLSEIREGTGQMDRAVGKGVLTSVAADCIVLPTSLLALLPDRDEYAPGTPILMVHGLYHNKSAWTVFRRRLKQAGFSNLHTYQYNSFTKDFDTALAGMEAKLNQVLAQSSDGKVILIGHSLGGLVSRCVAGKTEYQDRVAALITLGSPHKGSDLAWLGSNRMARSLIPGRYIAQKVEGTPDPNCPRLGIYTLTDDYVFPLDMLRTGRAGWKEQICSPMSHVWMLFSEEVAEMAIEFLRASKTE